MRRIVGLLVASVSLHAAVLAMLPARERSPVASLIQQSSLVTFESVPQPAERERAELLAPQSAPSAVASPQKIARPAQPPSEPQALEVAAAAPLPQVASVPRLAPEPLPEPARIDLSPRSAALSLVPQPSSGGQAQSPSDRDDLARRRSEELSADLHAAARAQVERMTRPSLTLELRREPDGTCHYTGNAIDATILPDGGVVFSDKPVKAGALWGVEEPPERVVTPDDAVAPQRLELGMRVQGRAWAAERSWFMRETEGIRRELADAARERELREGERTLRAQLDRIWCDQRRSKVERRRAIYAIWTDVGDGELGKRGRAVIAEYVRRHLPRGSADAYTGEELAQLATSFGAAQRFDPYAGGPASDAGL